jgi:hypothetical protein
MLQEVKTLSRAQTLSKEGRCPECGEFCYPYYRCKTHTMLANIRRALRTFEKKGWVDVEYDPYDKRVKTFKWNNKAPLNSKEKKYSPELIAKMSLPRLNGKPMTDKVIEECILKVLDVNNMPLTEKEINRGIKSMKTIGRVVPETEQLINEYKLIKQKSSKLSKNQRDAVEYRINFMLQRNAITQEQLTI